MKIFNQIKAKIIAKRMNKIIQRRKEEQETWEQFIFVARSFLDFMEDVLEHQKTKK